jgi:hypothetical protein
VTRLILGTVQEYEGSDMDLEQMKIELADVFVKYGKEIITAYLFGSMAKLGKKFFSVMYTPPNQLA